MIALPPSAQLLRIFSSRITTRLRAALALVAVIICAAGIGTALQMQKVLHTPAQLNGSALPMLALSQRIERELNAIFLTMDVLRQQDTTVSLETLNAEVANGISAVSRQLDELRSLGMEPALVDRLARRLQAAKRASGEVLRSRSALQRSNAEIATMLDRIDDLRERSGVILDDLSYRLSAQTDRLLRDAAMQAPAEASGEEVSNLLLEAINLNDLRLEIDALATIAVTQGLQGQPSGFDRARLQVREKLQNVIGRLPRISDPEKRRSLAVQTATMRAILLEEETGLFSHIAARQQFRAKLEALRAEHLPLIVEISDMTSDLTTHTLELVSGATSRLEATIRQVIAMVIATICAALIIIILANRLIIEQQFNQRIRRLTKAVNAIAQGNLDHPIPVTGRDELGEMARALVIFRRNAEELRRSNIELEKFAYVAAHDLRSPLRAVQELSTWVVEDEENRLSAESRAYMCLLQQRIERLNRLLKDLLDYARAGQNAPDPEPVDLGRLVRDISLGTDPEHRFEITYEGPSDPVWTQLTPLQQILGNLISNAIKHHDRDTGRIRVRAEVSAGRLTLQVEDDGPGIAPRYQARIFELFQTLRPRDEVEGSGLGLAIVNKLALHHKGSVTLISDPDTARGATFVVELPLATLRGHPAPQSLPKAA